MNRTRITAVLGGTMLSLLLTACPAQDWGPISSYYNGNRVVRASGTSSLVNSTTARNEILLEDSRADGNNVYATTNFYFWSPDSYGTWGWRNHTRSTTSEISNRTATFTHSRALISAGSRVRMVSGACAQMGWPVPDSCADESGFVTFDY
ncbi:MAG: hypothetical protein KF906_10980 [Actinobacteria bacterium]|nr:hypothetical protein [Actinomycetota bacterium]